MCPIKSIVRFGARVGLALLCPHRMIPARLCYPPGARLYHYYTCVVVVPLCLQRKLIRHRGGASLSDVGLLHNEHVHTRQEDKAVRVSSQNPIPATRQALGLRWGENPQSGQIDCVPYRNQYCYYTWCNCSLPSHIFFNFFTFCLSVFYFFQFFLFNGFEI